MLRLLLLIGFGAASVLQPPVLPLTVRTPYFSTWLHAREPPWQSWPIFWTGESLGLSILAKAENGVFPLLGRPHDSLKGTNVQFPQYLGAQFDASTTNLSYSINHGSGSASVIISFLSPITPTSTLRQAIPASYLDIQVDSSFEIAFYVDLNGQWISGDRQATVQWEMTNGSDTRTKTWTIRRRHQLLLNEINDRAEWGSLWFTGMSDLDHASGASDKLRMHFARHGRLSNETDERFRAIMDDEPVLAFAKTIQANSSTNLLFSLAHTQQHIVSLAMPGGDVLVDPLWQSSFDTELDMLGFHFHDYETAKALATNYSQQVRQDALAYAGQNYSDIVDLSARQVMGATSFGHSQGVKLFLKEISSNGNAQTVDIIFPAAPFFLYASPRWLQALLEPLLEHQLLGLYPNNYSMHDLGTHFPNLTGHADGKDERMPVEESGDMLIIALALANAMQYETQEEAQSLWSPVDSAAAGLDDAYGGHGELAERWIRRSWKLWQQWAEYLIRHSLWPENQLCTDDFAGELALQSNLALKGIIAIRAMSELAAMIGKDHKYYRNISNVYAEKWQEYALKGGRAKLAYNWQGSWTTLYSLYSDALLCFHLHEDTHSSDPAQKPLQTHEENFLPHRLYKQQSEWYASAMQRYGLPLDNRHLYSKSDWQLQAASVAMPDTRKLMIDGIALWINETKTDRPFSDLFDTEPPGGFPGPNFFARPVVGSHFAPLVLQRACKGRAADAFV